MSISTWGWGSCGGVITTWGWGPPVCVEYIPVLLATYLANSSAYSCVVTRKYIEIKTRDRSSVLLRVRPDSVSERVREQVLMRTFEDPLTRGDYSYAIKRDYVEIKTRGKDDILMRVRLDAMSQRVKDQLLVRSHDDPLVRSAGWPRESGELCD